MALQNTREKSPLLTCVLLIIIVWAVIEAKEFLIPIFASGLLALLMMPLVRWLRRRRVPEWLSVLLATIVLIAPLLLTTSLIVNESANLVSNWPQLQARAVHEFHRALELPIVEKLHIQEHLNVDSLANKAGETASHGITYAIAGLGALFAVGSELVLILFFAIMMIASREHLRTGFERILARYESLTDAKILEASTAILEKFLIARVIMIVFVAIADFIVLQCFGIGYSIILSVFLGVLTLVPAVGFVAGLIPPLIIAIAQGESLIAIVGLMVALWAISSLQDHLLTPKLIGRQLNLQFLMTYLAIFAGEKMWGVWGMFLSVPILGVFRILLNSSEEWRPFGQLIQERDDLTERRARKALEPIPDDHA